MCQAHARAHSSGPTVVCARSQIPFGVRVFIELLEYTERIDRLNVLIKVMPTDSSLKIDLIKEREGGMDRERKGRGWIER